ncbi:MAG: hypothetical protein ACK5LP_02570 [Campylobacteraceae bacterium]
MQKETFFDKLDAFFLSKKSTEIYLIYLVIIFVIGFLSYTYIFPMSETFLNTKDKQLTETKAQVQKHTNYYNDNVNEPSNLRKTITSITDATNELQFKNSYIDQKLKELSYLLFNDKSWAEFMDRITFLAKRDNIKISRITNDFLDNRTLGIAKVEEVLNVNVEFEGSFHDTLKFINSIEESNLVVDIKQLDLRSVRNDINNSIAISVWGMLY